MCIFEFRSCSRPIVCYDFADKLWKHCFIFSLTITKANLAWTTELQSKVTEFGSIIGQMVRRVKLKKSSQFVLQPTSWSIDGLFSCSSRSGCISADVSRWHIRVYGQTDSFNNWCFLWRMICNKENIPQKNLIISSYHMLAYVRSWTGSEPAQTRGRFSRTKQD